MLAAPDCPLRRLQLAAAYAGLGQSAHTFQVRARDPYGNTDPSPATRNWTVDTVAPDTVRDSGPTGPTGSSVSFTFHSNEAGTSFQCKLDAGGFSAGVRPCPFSASPTVSSHGADPRGGRGG